MKTTEQKRAFCSTLRRVLEINCWDIEGWVGLWLCYNILGFDARYVEPKDEFHLYARTNPLEPERQTLTLDGMSPPALGEGSPEPRALGHFDVNLWSPDFEGYRMYNFGVIRRVHGMAEERLFEEAIYVMREFINMEKTRYLLEARC